MDVLVFATNVTSKAQVSRVQNLLANLTAIIDWNFDLDECDNILRVVSTNISPRYIENLLHSAGVNCRELAEY
ncbi:hypothetical protein LT679_18310 [Mucilaginibacter roseus]|uniref:Uncharacterized protein n=1 Tax=Mucilaginibacter roseus TaxID=1528868 RepID=A0ABS8U635_9SPHI|nr:hypothetical protein [Mucilaginibacter roseus]MCD8742570.1 hypothetical protein [Mucilaginibacter roseus]